MNVTIKNLDSMDETRIPSVIDFAKAYLGKIDDTDTDLSGTKKIEELRDRPSFIFANPLVFTFFGGDIKVNTNDVIQRIIYMITLANGRKSLIESIKLLQFLWAAEKDFVKPTTLKIAPESDELETIQSVSFANFQRAEADKMNGRKCGDLEPAYDGEDEEEFSKTKRTKKKKEQTKREKKAK